MQWLAIAMFVFILQVLLVLFLEFRNPSKTTAWLLIIFLFPVLGFIMYYFIARAYQKRGRIRRRGRKTKPRLPVGVSDKIHISNRAAQLQGQDIHLQKRLLHLLQSIPDSPITACNETEIYANGKDTFESIIAALESARSHIHLEYYIIHADVIGTEIQQVLIRKAREGVEVRLIFDGLGSYDLSGDYIKQLVEAGVQVHCFMPLRHAFLKKSLNYRNHRKIVVVDGVIGFLGGINIGDEYLGNNPKFGFWRDTHMRLAGDAVFFLQQTFLKDWAFVSGDKLSDNRFYPKHNCLGKEHVQIVSSGPDAQWDTILEVYFSSISTAEERIFIVTPYFIPDPSIVMALKTAALSGVEVKVILPGLSDHIIVKWASLSFIEELMHAGVQFYLYQKGFIHAKILIVDEKIASVGTANLDMRSFFENFELNAVLFDKKTIDALVEDFDEDLAGSTEIVLEEFSKRSRYQRGKEVFARMLAPLL
jgi:cardiolipin synthase